jgi:hypothetical protein
MSLVKCSTLDSIAHLGLVNNRFPKANQTHSLNKSLKVQAYITQHTL